MPFPAADVWIERISDWANPILVKETRQALKSRQFIVTFMLLLGASWVSSLFGMMSMRASLEYGSAGAGLFRFYFYILAFATVVIVPFGAFRSLLAEREEMTADVLSITTLRPRQIVWGKLLSAMLQVFIFYSAIAPFIAFTALLQGFDIVEVSFMLVVAVWVSLVMSMFALMNSTMAGDRVLQALATVAALATNVAAFFTMSGLLESIVQFETMDAEFWWGCGAVFLASLTYLYLFQEIAAARLTFEAGNRSTGVRVAATVQFVIVWGMFAAVAGLDTLGVPTFVASDLEGLIAMTATLCAVNLVLVGLLLVTEEEPLSRRVRADLPRSLVRRALLAPFLPGRSRGFLYVVLHVAAGLALFLSAWGLFSLDDDLIAYTLGLFAYVLIYTGLVCALGRWLTYVSPDVRPVHVRTLAAILVVLAMIAPYLLLLTGRWYPEADSVLLITNPFFTLAYLADGSDHWQLTLIILAAGAGITLLLNLWSIQKGVRDAVFANVGRARTGDSPPHSVTPAG